MISSQEIAIALSVDWQKMLDNYWSPPQEEKKSFGEQIRDFRTALDLRKLLPQRLRFEKPEFRRVSNERLVLILLLLTLIPTLTACMPRISEQAEIETSPLVTVTSGSAIPEQDFHPSIPTINIFVNDEGKVALQVSFAGTCGLLILQEGETAAQAIAAGQVKSEGDCLGVYKSPDLTFSYNPDELYSAKQIILLVRLTPGEKHPLTGKVVTEEEGGWENAVRVVITLPDRNELYN